MQNASIVQKAVDLADLLSLSTEIGASAQICNANEIYLIWPGDTAPRMIGKSVTEAVDMLHAMVGKASIAQLNGISY